MADRPTSETDEAAIEKTQRALGTPVLLRSDQETIRTRGRLLLVSAVAIVIVAFNLHIRQDAMLLGINIENFGDWPLRFCLLILIVYLLVHFWWLLWDDYQAWLLCQTGTCHLVAITRGATDRVFSTEPRNSTLNNWWKETAQHISDFTTDREAINKWVVSAGAPNHSLVAELMNKVGSLDAKFQEAFAGFNARRPEASLRRFEAAFLRFRTSQEWRWFLFDALVPSLLGTCATVSFLASLWR